MSETVIKVENISKQYRIGTQERYKTFREALMNSAKFTFLKMTRIKPNSEVRKQKFDTFWALKNVSFEVKQGEVLGIIGRNGAGKTTLLKILSKITDPTQGKVELKGRVGSLLEIGTGFHPELTGHENVYLYGAILGMDRWEVTRKFDEIVAFAELEQFIDTPVKRYSSGMYMRLAFAVAAHLEPEILLVDEVLAVGDVAFQKKCLGKMGDVSRKGRTVLFVSHNLAAVSNLCPQAILLKEGLLVKRGKADDVISKYLRFTEDDGPFTAYNINEKVIREHQSNEELKIRGIELLDLKGNPIKMIATGDGLIIRILYCAKRKFLSPAFVFSIHNSHGIELVRLSTMPISGHIIDEIEGAGVIELTINELPFTGGLYFMSFGITRANIESILRLENVVSFHITPRDVYKSGLALESTKGLLTLRHSWNGPFIDK